MNSLRERLEPWLRDYLRKRHPELEPALLAAIDAFDAIARAGQVDPGALEPIVEAASSSRRPLYENATGFLGKLTGQYHDAGDAVERMARDSRSHVRFNAILCLDPSTPLDLTTRLLRQGLRDKSSKVRCKAADWCGRRRLRELVPDLEEAASRETVDKARATIVFELKLLRDGYILEPADHDGFYVTTYTDQGISSRRVRRKEIEERGLPVIIAELASP